MFKRILVPVDGSDTSNKALEAALQLARDSGGRVDIIHALDGLAYLNGFEYSAEVLEQASETARKVVDDALAAAKRADVPAEGRVLDVPGQRLGDVVAEEARSLGADLVVIGTHGRHGIGRLLLGSGAEQVIRLAPVPVLAVRTPETAAVRA